MPITIYFNLIWASTDFYHNDGIDILTLPLPRQSCLYQLLFTSIWFEHLLTSNTMMVLIYLPFLCLDKAAFANYYLLQSDLNIYWLPHNDGIDILTLPLLRQSCLYQLLFTSIWSEPLLTSNTMMVLIYLPFLCLDKAAFTNYYLLQSDLNIYWLLTQWWYWYTYPSFA